jgi:O-antigen/teichoic acid export membrane protein
MKVIKRVISSDVFILFSGSTIAQLIPFFISPILTRQFEPEQFGQVAFFNALLFPLIVLSTLRTELTLPLPEKDEQACHHGITAMIVSTITGLVILMVALFARHPLADVFGLSNSATRSLVWLGPAVVAGGMMQLATFWLIRKKQFRRVSYAKITQTSATGGVQLGIGAAAPVNGMVPGEFIGRMAAGIMAVFQSRTSGFSVKGYPGFRKGLRNLFTQYRSFVLYNSIPAFLDTASLNLPVIIASALFAEDTLGYFNFSRLIVGAPIALISLSVGQAFLPRLTDMKRNNQPLWPVLRRNMLIMLGAGIPAVAIAMLFAEPLFQLVFGDGWEESGRYTALLAIPYLAKFIVSPMSTALTVLERMNVVSMWQILNFASLVSLFFIPFSNPESFVIALCVVESVVYSLYLLLIFINVKRHDKTLGPHI